MRKSLSELFSKEDQNNTADTPWTQIDLDNIFLTKGYISLRQSIENSGVSESTQKIMKTELAFNRKRAVSQLLERNRRVYLKKLMPESSLNSGHENLPLRIDYSTLDNLINNSFDPEARNIVPLVWWPDHYNSNEEFELALEVWLSSLVLKTSK